MDGGGQSGKAHHGGEHHVNRSCLYYLFQCLGTRIHLDVGFVGEQTAEPLIVLFVGNDHSRWLEPDGLLCEQFHLVVGGEAVDFIQVGVLINYLQCLGSDGARRA